MTSILCSGAVHAGNTKTSAAAANSSAETATPATSSANDSVYTRYDWQSDCDVIDSSPPEGPGAWARLACPGPGDTLLMLADDDGRMTLDYATQRQFGPWESFDSFNHVHDTVEWRRHMQKGRMVPFATIHRRIVDLAEGEREILAISTVARRPGEESCMVGYVDATLTPRANRIARRVADDCARKFTCGTAQPDVYGQVNVETPRPHRAASS